jgi:hypothetical protein
MVTIKVTHKNYSWTLNALSFEHGVKLAEQLHERLGLIGRTYIECSNGNITWIR